MKYVACCGLFLFAVAGHCADFASSGEFPDGVIPQVTWNQNGVNGPSSKDEKIRPSSNSLANFQSPFTDSEPGAVRRKPQMGDGSLTTMRPYHPSDFDPFMALVKWQWSADVTVGGALDSLSKFLGYALIIRDTRVANVYSMLLPYSHRKVDRINAKTALEMLGGEGMMVVVDHANRTIMHRVKSTYDADYDVSALPGCGREVTFASMPSGAMADRVLIVGGVQCVY